MALPLNTDTLSEWVRPTASDLDANKTVFLFTLYGKLQLRTSRK